MKLFSHLVALVAALGIVTTAHGVELADGKLNIGGFADGQFVYTKETESPGFLLKDAALYIKAGNKKVDLNIDLPFSGGAASNDFSFATDKAQAYVTLHATSELDISMGQWDTIYGFELNDTKDVTFTSQGLVFDLALPTTHQGALVAYSNQGFTVKALISNPNNSGVLAGQNAEFGGQISYAHEDMFNIAVGYLGHNQAGDAGMDTLFDVVAGFKASVIDLDAEFAWNKVGGNDAAWGMLAQVVAEATKEVSFGVRGEWARKFDNYQDIQLTVGPQFKPADFEGLTVKADYTFTGSKVDSDSDTDKEHTIALAALYSF